MIGICVRVGSRSQGTKSQEHALKAWAKIHGEEVAWYRETHTGTTLERPALNNLVAATRGGRVRAES